MNRRPGRDHRDRRPQQDPVATPGSRESPTWVISRPSSLPSAGPSARCDGHDIAALDSAMRELEADRDVPGVVIADTVKGKGVSFMEDFAPDGDLYPFHSGAPDAATYEKAVGQLLERLDGEVADAGLSALQRTTVPVQPRAQTSGAKLVDAYSAALCAAGSRDGRDLVALDGDLVLDTGLIPFAASFPDRFIECGIAEQDMVSPGRGAGPARGASGRPLLRQLPLRRAHTSRCSSTPRRAPDRLRRLARWRDPGRAGPLTPGGHGRRIVRHGA